MKPYAGPLPRQVENVTLARGLASRQSEEKQRVNRTARRLPLFRENAGHGGCGLPLSLRLADDERQQATTVLAESGSPVFALSEPRALS